MDRDYTEAETMQVAQSILADTVASENGATVIGLSGDLGAGKTTLVKSVAQLLGVAETVVSPTFVIAKFYETADKRWQKLIHIDAYRIEDANELGPLGWGSIVESPHTLVIVEWPERIKTMLPHHTVHFTIEHRDERRSISRL